MRVDQIADTKERFLAGLAAEAGLDRTVLSEPGTSLRARQERAGTGIVVCYWAGDHALIWLDPDMADRFAPLADDSRAVDFDTMAERASGIGLELSARADMRVLGPSGPTPSGDAIGGYEPHWLLADDPDHVDLVRAFADRSDPDDVEAAALDELDDFAEHAINVLTSTDRPATDADGGSDNDSNDNDADGGSDNVSNDNDADGRSDSAIGPLVAYSSACDWDWDPGFADIGVLVDPAHRGKGLGRFVVAQTVARLLAEGRLPLYRHGRHNQGSMSIAVGTGFVPATTLAYFAPADADE